MTPQRLSDVRQRCMLWNRHLEGAFKEANQLLPCCFALDLVIERAAVEEGEGNLLRMGRAKNQRQDTCRDILAFVCQCIEVCERQFSGFDLFGDLGSSLITQEHFKRVASNNGQSGISIQGLLAWLEDDASRFQLNKGIVDVALILRHINDQAGWLLVIEQEVEVTPQLKKAAIVASDGRVGELQFRCRRRVYLLRVVPDHQSMVLDLFCDEIA